MVPHLTIARTNALVAPLFAREAKFLTNSLEPERLTPVKEERAEEECA